MDTFDLVNSGVSRFLPTIFELCRSVPAIAFQIIKHLKNKSNLFTSIFTLTDWSMTETWPYTKPFSFQIVEHEGGVKAWFLSCILMSAAHVVPLWVWFKTTSSSSSSPARTVIHYYYVAIISRCSHSEMRYLIVGLFFTFFICTSSIPEHGNHKGVRVVVNGRSLNVSPITKGKSSC